MRVIFHIRINCMVVRQLPSISQRVTRATFVAGNATMPKEKYYELKSFTHDFKRIRREMRRSAAWNWPIKNTNLKLEWGSLGRVTGMNRKRRESQVNTIFISVGTSSSVNDEISQKTRPNFQSPIKLFLIQCYDCE